MAKFPTITHVSLTVSDLDSKRPVVRIVVRLRSRSSTRTPDLSRHVVWLVAARRWWACISSLTWKAASRSTSAGSAGSSRVCVRQPLRACRVGRLD